MRGERVAIIGASADRCKYGNKAVRAYVRDGAEVFPVNPRADRIEGLRAFRSVLDIPGPLDRISVYVPPEVGIGLLEEFKQKGAREIFLNPGAESPELLEAARQRGLHVVVACSILDIGLSPTQFGND